MGRLGQRFLIIFWPKPPNSHTIVLYAEQFGFRRISVGEMLKMSFFGTDWKDMISVVANPAET